MATSKGSSISAPSLHPLLLDPSPPSRSPGSPPESHTSQSPANLVSMPGSSPAPARASPPPTQRDHSLFCWEGLLLIRKLSSEDRIKHFPTVKSKGCFRHKPAWDTWVTVCVNAPHF